MGPSLPKLQDMMPPGMTIPLALGKPDLPLVVVFLKSKVTRGQQVRQTWVCVAKMPFPNSSRVRKRSVSSLIHLSVHFFFSEMKVNDLGGKVNKKCFHRLNSEVKIAWCGLSHSAPCSGCKLRGKTKTRGSL